MRMRIHLVRLAQRGEHAHLLERADGGVALLDALQGLLDGGTGAELATMHGGDDLCRGECHPRQSTRVPRTI